MIWNDCAVDVVVVVCLAEFVCGSRSPACSQFAFWLAANLPLADSVRQRLLEEPTTVQRLQLLLRLMRLSGDCTDITCAQCRRPVSSIKEVFLMSRDGAIGNFVNPHGYIHQTVTMRKAANLALHGVPCEQDSWFPGLSLSFISHTWT